MELGAVRSNEDPKESSIRRDQVKAALSTQGIQCKSDDGEGEYRAMDHDYRGHVRFKDFCKFVKAVRAGTPDDKLYGREDSSMSSSELAADVARSIWEKVDPEHSCRASYNDVAHALAELFGFQNHELDATRELVASFDTDNNGFISFKEFRDYIKESQA